MVSISNKIYDINFSICDNIFINIFYIKPKYRGRGYSRKIIQSLQKKYDKNISLVCFPTLLKFYKKLGFEKVYNTNDGYIELVLRIK